MRLSAPQVVCATLTGVLGRNLNGKNGVFDVVYIDEAAQASTLRDTIIKSGPVCLQAGGVSHRLVKRSARIS